MSHFSTGAIMFLITDQKAYASEWRKTHKNAEIAEPINNSSVVRKETHKEADTERSRRTRTNLVALKRTNTGQDGRWMRRRGELWNSLWVWLNFQSVLLTLQWGVMSLLFHEKATTTFSARKHWWGSQASPSIDGVHFQMPLHDWVLCPIWVFGLLHLDHTCCNISFGLALQTTQGIAASCSETLREHTLSQSVDCHWA